MNTAIYLRVSTEEQADNGYGMDVQRQAIMEYIKENNLTLIAEYSDPGISGATYERPGLLDMLNHADKGEFSILLVYDSSRLARDMYVKGTIMHTLEKAGVSVLYVNGTNGNSPEEQLSRMIQDAIAHYVRLDILRKTKAGRDARGKTDGEKGGRVPMGYRRVFKDGKAVGVEIDPEGEALVIDIFNQRSAGGVLTQIADNLNEQGHTTARGHDWHASSVRQILLNEAKYKGGYRGESQEQWPKLLD